MKKLIVLGFFLLIIMVVVSIIFVKRDTETTAKTELSITKAITEEFSRKYNKPISDILVTVDIEKTGFAKGSIRFKDEMGGAVWFAAKTDEGWELAADGQGPMDCKTANRYGFPKDLVPGCIDTANNNSLMQR